MGYIPKAFLSLPLFHQPLPHLGHLQKTTLEEWAQDSPRIWSRSFQPPGCIAQKRELLGSPGWEWLVADDVVKSASQIWSLFSEVYYYHLRFISSDGEVSPASDKKETYNGLVPTRALSLSSAVRKLVQPGATRRINAKGNGICIFSVEFGHQTSSWASPLPTAPDWAMKINLRSSCPSEHLDSLPYSSSRTYPSTALPRIHTGRSPACLPVYVAGTIEEQGEAWVELAANERRRQFWWRALRF